jgi:hypothetical protein
MPEGPEVPQHGPLNIGYQFTPSVANLGGSHLFGGAGALWRDVGKTALEGASQLNQTAQLMEQSPLNPAVQAQMDYNVNQYDTASDRIDELNKTLAGRSTMSTGPQGLQTVPAASMDIDPMVRMRLLAQQKKQQPPTQPEQPAAPAASDDKQAAGQSDFAQHPEYYFQNPSTGSFERRFDAPPIQPAPQQPKTTAPGQKPVPTNPGDLLTGNAPSTGLVASTDNDQAMRQMIQNRGSSAAPEGTPSSMTFPNPATGNIEPLKADSIFAPRTAAAAPPAPGAPADQQPSTPGTVPGSLSDQYAQQANKEATQQWQQANIHPVIAPAQLLQAYKQNVSTLAQDATYMPSAGPGGAPAFAIHMKGGGTTTIPVSQIAQTSWGGPLIAAHNGSMILSHQQDQQQNGQQPGMPTGTGAGANQPVAATPLQQPNISPPPPANLPQQPNISPPPPANLPPAAPGIAPMPTGTGAAAPQPVSATPPGPPAAPGQGPLLTSPAYSPMAYRNAIAQAPGDLTAEAGQQAGTKSTDATTLPPGYVEKAPDLDADQFASNIFNKGYSQADLDGMKEDPVIGDWNGYRWRQDRIHGQFYASKMSHSSTLNEERYVWGSPGWKDTPMDESAFRQTLRDMAKTIPGDVMTVSDDETRTMPIERVKQLVNAGKLFLATEHSDSQGPVAKNIQSLINQSLAVHRILDGLDATKKAGIDPADYSGTAEERSANAARRDDLDTKSPFFKLGPEYPFGLAGQELINPADAFRAGLSKWHDMWASGEPVHPLADYVHNQIKLFDDQMGLQQGIPYSAGSKPENQGAHFDIGPVPLKVPWPGDVSPIQQLTRITQNQPQGEVRPGVVDLARWIDKNLAEAVDEAKRTDYRVPPEFKMAADAVRDGNGAIPDLGNKFRDKRTGELTIPDELRDKPRVPSKTFLTSKELQQPTVWDKIRENPEGFFGPEWGKKIADAIPGFRTGTSPVATPTPTPSPTPSPTPAPVTGTGSFTASRSANAAASPTPMETVDPTNKSAIDEFQKNHPEGGLIQFGTNPDGSPKTFRVHAKKQ